MKNSPTRTMTAKRIAVAVAAVCATMSAPSFAAGGDMKALMDLLLKKGVITQQEYDQNIQAAKDAAEDQAFKEKRLADDVAKLNKAAEKSAKSGFVKSNGLGFESADGANSINLTGRLHFDGRSFSDGWGTVTDRDSASMGDRFTVRRARLGVTGVFQKNLNYELITNITGATANNGSTVSTAVVDTGWLNYTVDPAFQVRVGKMKQPSVMETLTSSNNIDFMERSYVDQMAPGKQNGVMAHGEVKGVNYAVSGYQTGFDPLNNSQSISPQYGARVSTDLANAFGSASSKMVFHVGVSATGGKFSVVPTTSSQTGKNFETKGAFIAFRDENLGLNNVYRDRIYGTCPSNSAGAGGGNTPDCSLSSVPVGYSLPAQDAATVDKFMSAFESAVAYGPAKVQYEYADAKLTAKSHAQTVNGGSNWDTESSGHAKAQYLSLVYNLTGEDWKDSYKGGLFGAVKPKSNFNIENGTGFGAWQLALRISKYDASDFGTASSANDEEAGNGGKHTCAGSGSNNCYQIGGSPKATTYTAGLNWLLNPNARLMLNYSRTNFGNAFFPIDVGTAASHSKATDRSDVISVRSQFNF